MLSNIYIKIYTHICIWYIVYALIPIWYVNHIRILRKHGLGNPPRLEPSDQAVGSFCFWGHCSGVPSSQYSRTLVPNTIKGMVFGIRNLKYWVLGPSGAVGPLVAALNKAESDNTLCSRSLETSCCQQRGLSDEVNAITSTPMANMAVWTAVIISILDPSN